MDRPRIGAVSYLNTKPLVEGMADLGSAFDLVFDLPSRLADQLAAGELEAALIPSVEAISGNYTVVSDACIGCHGPVWSVKLLGRVAPEKIRTLALDEGSRTSCILSQVILAKKYGVRPACRLLGIAEDWREAETDAVLIIGDRAMKVDDSEFEFSWDLGEAWFQMTGLPFVFAVWAARSSEHLDQLDWLLSTTRDTGLKNLDRIAARYAQDYDLTSDECLRYLRDRLHFKLTGAEKAGLSLFFEYANELSLISNQKLQFHDCPTP
jgi:chorismate dehydratase